jgi:hypothetical protein
VNDDPRHLGTSNADDNDLEISPDYDLESEKKV